MQHTDNLTETAHKPDGPAIMNATIGLTAHGSVHGPKAMSASPASLISPANEDARRQESGRVAPRLLRAGPDLLRAGAMAGTLATLRSQTETLTEVAHDARNMVTALGLYCEFLEEPGVLATPFQHYGQELRLVAAASRRLVEKIVALDYQANAQTSANTSANIIAKIGAKIGAEAAAKLAVPAAGPRSTGPMSAGLVSSDPVSSGLTPSGPVPAGSAQRESQIFSNPNRRWDLLPTGPVANLAAELAVNRNLLAALAGPSIALTVHAEGCARPVWLSGEDLTRVLVNLVKNSAEAMLSGGCIDIRLREIGLSETLLYEQPAKQTPEHADHRGAAASLLLTVEDDGPGIPAEAMETIFVSGFTSHGINEGHAQGSPGSCSADDRSHADRGPIHHGHGHRGLGLTISRSIVEGAGGRITAANREQGGARFALELPLRQAN